MSSIHRQSISLETAHMLRIAVETHSEEVENLGYLAAEEATEARKIRCVVYEH